MAQTTSAAVDNRRDIPRTERKATTLPSFSAILQGNVQRSHTFNNIKAAIAGGLYVVDWLVVRR
jgi:hypothetical protein